MSSLSIPQDSPGFNPLVWLTEHRATFALPKGRTKDKFELNWQNTPHTLEQAQGHARSGGNVGLLTGEHSNGICPVDRDVDFWATVAMLGNLAHTAKVVRDNAPDRGKLLYRVIGELPPTKAWRAGSCGNDGGQAAHSAKGLQDLNVLRVNHRGHSKATL